MFPFLSWEWSDLPYPSPGAWLLELIFRPPSPLVDNLFVDARLK